MARRKRSNRSRTTNPNPIREGRRHPDQPDTNLPAEIHPTGDGQMESLEEAHVRMAREAVDADPGPEDAPPISDEEIEAEAAGSEFMDEEATLIDSELAAEEAAAQDDQAEAERVEGPFPEDGEACGRDLADAGWYCTRSKGHDGPCAAIPDPALAAELPQPHRAIDSAVRRVLEQHAVTLAPETLAALIEGIANETRADTWQPGDTDQLDFPWPTRPEPEIDWSILERGPLAAGIQILEALLEEAKGGHIAAQIAQLEDVLGETFDWDERAILTRVASEARNRSGLPDVAAAYRAVVAHRVATTEAQG
jgi:hypothetical protein